MLRDLIDHRLKVEWCVPQVRDDGARGRAVLEVQVAEELVYKLRLGAEVADTCLEAIDKDLHAVTLWVVQPGRFVRSEIRKIVALSVPVGG